MKKYVVSLLGLFAAILMTACSEDNYEEPEVSVSKMELNFTNQGGEESVDVETNKDSWNAYSVDDGKWINLSVNESKLSVAVKPNIAGESRKTTILVSSLGDKKTIVVNQSAAGNFIKLSSNVKRFGVEGGSVKVNFNSNSSLVSVTPEDECDWLSVSYSEGDSYFTADVADNNGSAERRAVINVSAGQSIEQFTVVQTGKTLIPFPIFEQNSTLAKILNFEEARGSRLINKPDFMFPMRYRFSTTSGDFPTISYDYDMNSNAPNYLTASLLTANEDIINNKALFSQIDEVGFDIKKMVQAEDAIFIPGKEGFKYNIIITFPAGGVLFTFEYVLPQPEDWDTFTKFPYGLPLDWCCSREGQRKGKLMSEVVMFEEELGSISDPEHSTGYFKIYKLPDGQPDSDNFHFYWAVEPDSKNGISEDDPYIGQICAMRYLYKDIHKALWNCNGQWILTRKFKERLNEGEFKYIQDVDGYKVYARIMPKTATIAEMILVGLWQPNENVDPVLDIQSMSQDITQQSQMYYVAEEEVKGHKVLSLRSDLSNNIRKVLRTKLNK